MANSREQVDKLLADNARRQAEERRRQEKTAEIKEETDALMAQLPDDKDLRGAISYMAYEQGHSAGEDEVLNCLRGLVGDLKGPLRAFEARCRREGVK